MKIHLMPPRRTIASLALLCLSFAVPLPADDSSNIAYVTVKTKSELNKEAKIYYRIPAKLKEMEKGSLCRVLVYFGGRNCTGEKEAAGKGLGFGEWADQNNVVIVAPGFKDDDYWDPQKWSGEALLKGLAEIKKDYPICTDRLLFYGYSAGSQCANLFPAWKPNLCLAWVSHACGVFHTPTPQMRFCHGLVTCGDADSARYMISREFIANCRKQKLDVLWKSFPNHPHDVPPDSVELALTFLTLHHTQNLDDLKKPSSSAISERQKKKTELPVLYVGDDQEGRFWDAGNKAVAKIEPEDRVEFTSRELALAWGKEMKPREKPQDD